MREKGERAEKRGQEYLSRSEDRGLTLGREETRMAHRQMVMYKGKGGNAVLREVFNFN